MLATLILLAAEAALPNVNLHTYVIGVEDVLAVHVWREPEVSRRVPVRPDGNITLPLINDIKAAGATPNQLAQRISDALKKHLTEAEVAVVVEQVNSKKFYVMGEVVRPGAYPLVESTTVIQALSAAGGFREFANKKKIQILKGGGSAAKRIVFDYSAVVRGSKDQHNVVLEPGDTILVP